MSRPSFTDFEIKKAFDLACPGVPWEPFEKELVVIYNENVASHNLGVKAAKNQKKALHDIQDAEGLKLSSLFKKAIDDTPPRPALND